MILECAQHTYLQNTTGSELYSGTTQNPELGCPSKKQWSVATVPCTQICQNTVPVTAILAMVSTQLMKAKNDTGVAAALTSKIVSYCCIQCSTRLSDQYSEWCGQQNSEQQSNPMVLE